MVMSALGLLTGMVQAYIFSVLATVFIAAAAGHPRNSKRQPNLKGDTHG
jgi:F-type H+-transporting ATPase subunit a